MRFAPVTLVASVTLHGLLLSAHAPAGPLSGYIGTFTSRGGVSNGSRGIYRFRWDGDTGTLSDIREAAETASPTFLVIHPNGRTLYAVNDGGADAAADGITTFAIGDSESALPLRNLGTVSSMGKGPCHVSLDATGRWLFAANYRSGSIAVFPVRPDGALGAARQTLQPPEIVGTDRVRRSPHAHEVVPSPDGHFVLSVDLGLDRVFVYRFDAGTGRLSANSPAVEFPRGYGPRHLLFSRDAQRVYVLTELTARLITFRWDAPSGTLTRLAETAAAPSGYTGSQSGAELALTPDGRWLYVSNRAESNSIVGFGFDAGLPVAIGSFASGGRTPRFIGIDPAGRFLLAANQDSDNLVVFRIDAATGRLTPHGDVPVTAPVDLVFASLPQH